MACLAGACSSDNGGNWLAFYRAAKVRWAGSDQRITLKEAAAVPGASAGMRIGDGPERLLVLAASTARNDLWISRAHIAIATDHGRIDRTVGLASNLAGYTARGGATGSGRLSPSKPVTWTWEGDFPDLNVYSIRVVCHDRPAGSETIRILGRRIRTTRIDERCRSQRLDWSFENTFWVGAADGVVWQSIQHVHPQLDAIEIRLFRPPA